MKLERRAYQDIAVGNVETEWSNGARSVLLVAPTGSGKTELGRRLVGARSTLWCAHRRELVNQAADRLRAHAGRGSVGIIMAGEHETPSARIQVGTVQTLIARGRHPEVELVVLDEAHHYMAVDWKAFADTYPNAKFLGLTATPERKDGEALGDIFERLVVAANYSELIRDGYLVPARVLQPPMNLGNDLAQDPLDAWAKHAEGSLTFCFAGRVDIAKAWAQRWRDHGVIADTIDANTPKRERDEILTRFKRGLIRCLMNVNTMTEGVDVPEARAAILARAFGHVGGYLQAAGRVLRPAKDKPDAILIDLCGATLRHGLPTQDRKYSLTGRAISGGMNHGGGGPGEFEQSVKGVELRMVSKGAWTAESATETAWLTPVADERAQRMTRLRSTAKNAGAPPSLASIVYMQRYGQLP